MDRLWSPWRLPYVIGSRSEPGCVFCDALGRSEPDSLVLYDGETCFVILNLYPYNNGHLMVVPHRHTGTLASLSEAELRELAVLTQRAEIALGEAYQPHGINIGLNSGKPAGAGILDHNHIHLVPRWNGDTNFMTVTGNTRVLPEELGDTARRLRPIFQRLGRT